MSVDKAKVAINNKPTDCEQFIVARYDRGLGEFWYYGSWDNRPQAVEISKIVDGFVMERMDDGI